MADFELKTLQDIVKKDRHAIKRGPFGGSLKKNIFVPSGYKVYEQKNVIQNNFEIGHYFVTDKKYKEMKVFAVSSGDFLISCSGTIGKIAVVPEDAEKGIINQALLKLSLDSDKILPNYFKYLFESDLIQRRLTKISRGIAIKNVPSVKELKQIKFPVPNIGLQQKITQSIETQFTRLDAAIKSLKAIKAKLELYRKSVLKAAFDGKLCETLSSLKESELNAVAGKITDGTHLTPPLVSSGIPMLDVGDLDEKFNVIFDNPKKFISEKTDAELAKKCKPQIDDILISSRGTIGRIGIVRKGQNFNIMGNMIIVRVNKKILNVKYTAYNLKFLKYKFEGLARGVAQKGLYLGNVRRFKLKYPESLSDQGNVVSEIETRFSVIDKLEEVVDASLVKAENLRKSILKSAFEGKLI